MICDRVEGTKPRNASKRKNTRRSANGQRPREGMRASRELLAGQLGQADPWERGAEGPGRAGGTWLGGRGQCILTPWRESRLLRSRAADAPCVGRPTETGLEGGRHEGTSVPCPGPPVPPSGTLLLRSHAAHHAPQKCLPSSPRASGSRHPLFLDHITFQSVLAEEREKKPRGYFSYHALWVTKANKQTARHSAGAA